MSQSFKDGVLADAFFTRQHQRVIYLTANVLNYIGQDVQDVAVIDLIGIQIFDVVDPRPC